MWAIKYSPDMRSFGVPSSSTDYKLTYSFPSISLGEKVIEKKFEEQEEHQ